MLVRIIYLSLSVFFSLSLNATYIDELSLEQKTLTLERFGERVEKFTDSLPADVQQEYQDYLMYHHELNDVRQIVLVPFYEAFIDGLVGEDDNEIEAKKRLEEERYLDAQLIMGRYGIGWLQGKYPQNKGLQNLLRQLHDPNTDVGGWLRRASRDHLARLMGE